MIAPPPPIRVYEAEESFESRRAKLEQDSRMDAKSKQAILELVDFKPKPKTKAKKDESAEAKAEAAAEKA